MSNDASAAAMETPVKRKPGRPKKVDAAGSATANQAPAARRKPGRPKKDRTVSSAPQNETTTVSSNENTNTNTTETAVKRKPGRPRKDQSQPQAQQPAQAEPNAETTKAEANQPETTATKRKPGRPRKDQSQQAPAQSKSTETTSQDENIIRVVPFTASPEQVIGTVEFIKASYRGFEVNGTYDLIKLFKEGGNGDGFVTIREPNGKRTRVTVASNSEGTDYKLNLNEKGLAMLEKMNSPRKPGRPRNPDIPRKVTLESTLIPHG